MRAFWLVLGAGVVGAGVYYWWKTQQHRQAQAQAAGTRYTGPALVPQGLAPGYTPRPAPQQIPSCPSGTHPDRGWGQWTCLPDGALSVAGPPIQGTYSQGSGPVMPAPVPVAAVPAGRISVPLGQPCPAGYERDDCNRNCGPYHTQMGCGSCVPLGTNAAWYAQNCPGK